MKIKTIDKVHFGFGGIKLVHTHITWEKGLAQYSANWKKVKGDLNALIATCPRCKKTTICFDRRKL